jgi:hypothetical protein
MSLPLKALPPPAVSGRIALPNEHSSYAAVQRTLHPRKLIQ